MGDFGGPAAAQNNINQSQAFAAALQRAKQVKIKFFQGNNFFLPECEKID